MAGYWLFGVLLAVVGSWISNLGLNLQKLTHVHNAASLAAKNDEDEGDLSDTSGEGQVMPPPLHSRTVNIMSTAVPSSSSQSPYKGERTASYSAVSQALAPMNLDDDVNEPSSSVLSPTSLVTSRAGSASSTGAAPSASNVLASEVPVADGYPYYRQPLWVLGLSLVIIGSFLDFAALGFAAQTVVAPLGSMTLVSNVVFAQYFSGERVSRHDLYSTAGIIIGSCVSVAFASHKDEAFTFSELFGYYYRFKFAVYAFCLVSLLIVLRTAIDIVRTAVRNPGSEQATLVQSYTQVTPIKAERFLCAASSGIVGAQSVLFAKALAEMVREDVLTMVITGGSWFVIVSMALCIFLQIKWLNEGLKKFDALYMVPVFQAFWILFSVFAGLVVYDEADAITLHSSFWFTVGLGITISGVVALSHRDHRHRQSSAGMVDLESGRAGRSSSSTARASSTTNGSSQRKSRSLSLDGDFERVPLRVDMSRINEPPSPSFQPHDSSLDEPVSAISQAVCSPRLKRNHTALI